MADKMIEVRPVAPFKVIDPERPELGPLPAKGAEVPDTPYWRSRIREGMVIDVAAEAEAKAAAKAAKKAATKAAKKGGKDDGENTGESKDDAGEGKPKG